jgi:hypothetical protein
VPSQRQIERFTLEFHRVAIGRLRVHPEYLAKAIEVLNRWEVQGASPRSQVYRDEWRRLLQRGVDDIEQFSCVDTDDAATIRSMSPLGFVLSEQERLQIRREAMAL